LALLVALPIILAGARAGKEGPGYCHHERHDGVGQREGGEALDGLFASYPCWEPEDRY